MVEEEDGKGEAGTGRLGRLGNTGAFCPYGCGSGCFGAGGTPVQAARGILGTNHNHCDYTVVAGSGAEGILATFRRDGAWSGGLGRFWGVASGARFWFLALSGFSWGA